MTARRLRLFNGVLPVALAGFFLATLAAGAQNQSKPDLDKIPKKVMDALKAKFPNPEIQKWTRETEEGIVLYDIELTQGGRKFEADIREDGTLQNWEREIPVRDLPAAVTKAVNARYPGATLKEAMATTTVKNGKDEPEGYEVVLDTAGKKEVEVTVAPDGRILEDSGEQK